MLRAPGGPFLGVLRTTQLNLTNEYQKLVGLALSTPHKTNTIAWYILCCLKHSMRLLYLDKKARLCRGPRTLYLNFQIYLLSSEYNLVYGAAHLLKR